MPEVAAVLVSVRPEYARAIAAGSKRVELRRRFPKVRPGMWLVLYATLPVGAIVGMARIEGVDVLAPGELWREHQSVSGVSKATFDAYFDGCDQAFAVRLGEFVQVTPLSHADMGAFLPGFRPPQSFRYLEAEAVLRLRRRTEGSAGSRSGTVPVEPAGLLAEVGTARPLRAADSVPSGSAIGAGAFGGDSRPAVKPARRATASV